MSYVCKPTGNFNTHQAYLMICGEKKLLLLANCFPNNSIPKTFVNVFIWKIFRPKEGNIFIQIATIVQSATL
jgi:hypothetical protein